LSSTPRIIRSLPIPKPISAPPGLASQRHFAAVVTAVLVAGCSGGNPVTPPGPPAALAVAEGGDQTAAVGMPVPIAPTVRVRDASGRGVAGISVRFDVVGGNGSVTGDSVVTNADGEATVGEWRLGPIPGTNTLRAQTINHPFQITITATSTTGAPSSVQVVSGANLTAVVGQEVVPRPAVRVRDPFGNPIANATVTWTVLSGGGSIIGPATTTTNAEGLAQVGGWRLGTNSGTNLLQARTANGISATFTALAIGIPSSIEPVSPVTQDGFTNFGVPKTARVRVLDIDGAIVPGVPVVFTMVAGDGTISGETTVTDANGVAALGDWRLGPGGFSQVSATVPGFTGPAAVFTANGVAKAFVIDVRFVGPLTADIRDAYIAAALRWMEIITGDLPDYTIPVPPASCFGGAVPIPPVAGPIDDLVIFASVVVIDGVSNVLGRAGSCEGGERPSSSLTALGAMQFDIDDANTLINDGRFTSVVIHEMGHVLGLYAGRYSSRGLAQGIGGGDPYFTGTQARAAWPLLGIAYAGNIVPLENQFGGGSRDHHWREGVLEAELMTSIVEAPGVPMPVSAVTVGAMADLGYVVDPTKADPFAPSLIARPTQGRLLLREVLYRNGIPVD
jgi:hypothetical protein